MMRMLARSVLVGVALGLALIIETALIPSLHVLPVLPSVVLLVVVACALRSGPVAGAGAGFAGGLLLDVAPPAVATLGSSTLVFTLVGAAAGYAQLLQVRSRLLKVPLAAAVVAGSTLAWIAGLTVVSELLGQGPTGASWANALRVVGPTLLTHLGAAMVVLPAVHALVGLVGEPAAVADLLPTQRSGVPKQVQNLPRPVSPALPMYPAMIRKGR